MTDPLLNFGAELDSDAAIRLLEHVFETNLNNEEASAAKDPNGQGKRPTPICIWGAHGIGKTAVVKNLAKKHGWKFRYCAPAQFEEMGDLHGLAI